MIRFTTRPARVAIASLFLACLAPGRAQVAPAAAVQADDTPVELGQIDVVATNEDDEFDATGMGSVEQQLRDEPFSNSLIGPEEFSLDAEDIELAGEISAIAEPSPADRIAGEDRLNLRGFPTPVLRNGFIQIGIPETLNTSQTIVIQGPLVPVLGRAAPGGIQNFLTARPRTRPQNRVTLNATNRDRQRIGFETNGALVEKKAWQRLAVEWQRRDGPEEFAREEARVASASLTWKHSRAASTLVSLDYREVRAFAAPGIPEYRPVGAPKIVGPYLPLALFNANGPDAAVHRRSAVAGIQFDGQPAKNLAVRAGVAGWWRAIEQDRFTTSQLVLDTGLFAGTREPRHLEQPQRALVAQLEATWRFRRWGAEHKLMASASNTWGEYLREERALSFGHRNALPLSVRRFDPFDPDYFRPAYDPDVYSRVLTDRDESARYGSLELSDRMAFRNGRLVVTTGLRYDEVDLDVKDLRTDAAIPRTRDGTSQLSHHAGVNYQLYRDRVLLFASTSTAFDPSTPVDARTGRIQENETTLGYETGVKGRGPGGKIDYTASGFVLFNRNISRRNPLYNDPVADAAQTQPQLVAAGEERFTGGRVELRWKATPELTVGLKASRVRAITTESPDLPQEIGRPITRLPPFNISANIRHRPRDPKGGLTWSAGWQYLDGYVANYEDSRREFLQYPGYGLVSVGAGWLWNRPKRQISIDAGLRNVFDRDLLLSNARLGANREFSFSGRVMF